MKKLLLSTVLLTALFGIPKAHAAITIDASSTFQANAATISGSMTVGAGSNNVVVMGIYAGSAGTPSINQTSIDGNTGVFTYIGQTTQSNTRIQFMYIATNVSASAHTFAASSTAGTTDMGLDLISFMGVNQTTPTEASTSCTAAGPVTAFTCNTTTVQANDVLVLTVRTETGGTFTAGASTTIATQNGATAQVTAYSTNPVVTPGSASLTVNQTDASNWKGVMAALIPAAAAATTAPKMQVVWWE